ncbi:MAG TPA: serine hydrolase domain-containing protein [Pyrinomonadaceae bacterium]|nr:serine hydrolase domain-containing protein [Pyrinomonadaceae bacterium]
MSQRMTRRQLMAGGARAAAALGALKTLGASPVRASESRAARARAAAQTLTPSAVASERAAKFRAAFALLDEFIARHLGDVGAPGLTLAIADREGLLRASVHGLADTKTKERVRLDTLFQIGSISKSVVALALLQLRDEGKLDLHRPVSEYLPWLKVKSAHAPFTTHHLLTHTAGLPGGISFLVRAPNDELWTAYAPGEHFVYSNPGYDILGRLLETLDGRPFAVALRERVLRPLGMRVSEPIITHDVRTRMATGYAPLYDDRPFPRAGRLAEAPWVEMTNAAGSVASTPTDMAAYLSMILSRGRTARGARLVSEESFNLFVKPAVDAPFRGEPAGYAYGVWVSDKEGHTLVRHTGGMVAFSSAFYADLTDGLAAFASVNANLAGYRPVAVTRYALDLLSATLAAKELPAAPPSPPPADVVKNAAMYAGTFTSPTGKKLVLEASGERLSLVHAGERVVLQQAGLDRFIVPHPDFALFALGFGREGERVVEAWHGADWYAGAGYTGAREFSHPKEWEGYAGHYRSESPWFGSARIVLRKGKLWLGGEQALAPLGANVFRPAAADWSPERITFEAPMGGRATRLNVSGNDFFRVPTP